jgi:VanZ family protein
MVRWLLVGLWYAAIIFTSSLTSTPETGQPFRDYLTAKAGHVFVYSVLGWLTAEALTAPAAGLALGKRVALFTTVLLGAVLASLDETRQTFVYGRTGQIADVLLDTLALSGGALLHDRLMRRSRSPAAHQQPPEDAGEERPAER